MREIKFRAWDKRKAMMVLPTNEEYAFEIYLDGSFSVFGTGLIEGISRSICRNSDDFILMQFTGLRDKNGREIYEGDILRSSIVGQPLHVKWNNASAGFNLAWIEGHVIEIIGNRFENPELLEAK